MIDDSSPGDDDAIAVDLMDRHGAAITVYEVPEGRKPIVIPAGLSRPYRRAYLNAHPTGVLVLSEMSDEEFADFCADERPARHAIQASGLSEVRMRALIHR